MKRLSALAPDLDIFGSQFILRDDAGWQLTETGRTFLTTIEKTASRTPDRELTSIEVVVTLAPARQLSTPLLRLVATNSDKRAARSRKDRTNRTLVA